MGLFGGSGWKDDDIESYDGPLIGSGLADHIEKRVKAREQLIEDGEEINEENIQRKVKELEEND